ncbi:MAG TPA: hypothetical protein VMO26_18720 [Vicinamibacterales bacterium]|nr:hypothetical protein [Vicinamibacterales bacterium]
MDNINWGPEDSTPAHRQQNNPADGREVPGDTDAPDIVGRTGEEMPEVTHDTTEDEPPQ